MTQAPPGAPVSSQDDPALLRPPTPALPLRFHAPDGWPEPSAWWVATHQGWQPEAGWTPEPGCEAAPAGWLWWSRHPDVWSRLTRRAVAQYRRGMVAGALLFVVALAVVVSPIAQHSSLRVLLWGALLYGPAEVARDLMALTTLGDRFDAYARRRAARLVDTARDDGPTSAQELAAFFVPKAGPGNDEPLRQTGRIATMVVAGALAAALIVMLADAFVNSTMGSGAH